MSWKVSWKHFCSASNKLVFKYMLLINQILCYWLFLWFIYSLYFILIYFNILYSFVEIFDCSIIIHNYKDSLIRTHTSFHPKLKGQSFLQSQNCLPLIFIIITQMVIINFINHYLVLCGSREATGVKILEATHIPIILWNTWSSNATSGY